MAMTSERKIRSSMVANPNSIIEECVFCLTTTFSSVGDVGVAEGVGDGIGTEVGDGEATAAKPCSACGAGLAQAAAQSASGASTMRNRFIIAERRSVVRFMASTLSEGLDFRKSTRLTRRARASPSQEPPSAYRAWTLASSELAWAYLLESARRASPWASQSPK